MSGQLVARTPKGLYRYLLRRLASLPEDAHHYYKHRIRQVRLGCYELELARVMCEVILYQIQWNLRTMDTVGTGLLSIVERLSLSQRLLSV